MMGLAKNQQVILDKLTQFRQGHLGKATQGIDSIFLKTTDTTVSLLQ